MDGKQQKLVVRELEERDIPLIDTYWRSLTQDDLNRMSIDCDRIPASDEFRARLTKLLDTPLSDRASDPLVWEVDGTAVGFTNLNNISRGNQADIHLHMFDSKFRGKGLGRRLFVRCVQKYFQRHHLTKIICQPASTNPGPTGLMRALRIPVSRT